MTTPAFGIRSIVWTPSLGDAVDMMDLPNGLWFTVKEGLDELPSVRATNDVIPFRPGRLRSQPIADVRKLLLPGQIVSDDDLYAGVIARLKRAFDPTLDQGSLAVTLEDWSVRTIFATPSSMLYGELFRIAPAVSIEFDAEPYWRGPQWGAAWTLDMGLDLDAGLTLDLAGGPVTINPTGSPYAHAFGALGTTYTRDALVEVDGPSSGAISVANADGIGFAYPALSGGQTLSVDAGRRTVKIGTASVRQNLTLLASNEHGEYFRLRPGPETVTVTGHPAEVRISFAPTYL